MLPLPSFDYADPREVAEAVTLAATPGARFVSGGTDLLPSMKHRIFAPTLLVSTRRIAALREVERTAEGGLRLGAGLTLREVGRNPAVVADYPALAAAARTVATPTVQAMGTLGGNVMLDTRCMYYNQPQGWRVSLGGCLKCEGTVCHVAPKGKGCYAAHSADTVPVLTLLGAVAVFATAAGEVPVPVAELYGDDGRTWLRHPPGSLLVRVELPPPSGPVAYRKFRLRGAIDYAQLLTAVRPTDEGWRAVISAVGPAPVQVAGATPEALVEAAMAAVQPLSTHLASPAWRKKLVRVELSRAIATL